MKTLPKTIFVRIETDDNPPWLSAMPAILDHAELGKKRKVGVYTLTEVREVEGVASHHKVKG